MISYFAEGDLQFPESLVPSSFFNTGVSSRGKTAKFSVRRNIYIYIYIYIYFFRRYRFH